MSPSGQPVNLLLLGNTGSGKSFIGKALGGDFAPGRSDNGNGVTRVNKEAKVVLFGVEYNVIDTPGLVELDEKRMQENADQIVKALKTGGQFKILVVVREEGGRDDSRLGYFAKKIRDSLQGEVKVGFVMNLVRKGDAKRITNDSLAATCKRYNEKINAEIFNPKYVMRIFDAGIEEDDYTSIEAENAFKVIKSDLRDLLEVMTPVTINPDDVKPIVANKTDFDVWKSIWGIATSLLSSVLPWFDKQLYDEVFKLLKNL
ncbi:hypothetical protein BGZ88_004295 [Linnemannia elongata]|nr:hypothetical protein BGZ88_004294 [Linnemannia elongata]KAF9272862.1 hypothetical protein BGZ88_004295 [Linnemannia elongata]